MFKAFFFRAVYYATRPLALIFIIPFILIAYKTYPLIGFFAASFMMVMITCKVGLFFENRTAPQRDVIHNVHEKKHVDKVIAEMEKQFHQEGS